MKRVITYLTCAAWLFVVAAPVGAVDKKEDKSKTEQKKDSTATKDSLKTAKKDSTGKPISPAVRPGAKKYDNFIDQNKNGIDDRRENLKRKAPAKTDQKKDSDSTKTKK